MTEPKPSILPVLRESLVEYYSKERKGPVHISDITYCIRKKIFQIEKPTPLTDKDLNNFSSGRGIDGCIRDLTYIKKERFRTQAELWLSRETGQIIPWFQAKKDDIVGTPDIWDLELDMPIELKSNKTESIWMDKFNTMDEPPPTSNTKQLLFYMAMSNRNHGRLLIQYLNQKKKSPWREIDYYKTDEELVEIRQQIVFLANLFRRARDAHDPALAPHVANNPDENYACKVCPYKKECNKIRKAAGEDV